MCLIDTSHELASRACTLAWPGLVVHIEALEQEGHSLSH